MELFTTELTKFKKLSEKFTKNCELLQTEVNLLNKLLFCEQMFSNHLMNQMFVLYDNILYDIKQNGHNSNAWNRLEREKSIAKQNESEVKKLRQELKSWRLINNRLTNERTRLDHCYASQIKSPEKRTNSCDTQTNTVVKTESKMSPSVSVKLEVIPKTEPEDNICEDTDTASEGEQQMSSKEDNDCLIEGVEPTIEPNVEPKTAKSDASKPFLFVTEYLSQIKGLLNENKEKPNEKKITIDLSDSEETKDMNETSIPCNVSPSNANADSGDGIVDLTPKTTPVKRKFIKQRVKFGKKRRKLRNSPKNKESIDSNTSNTSTSDNRGGNSRIIGSNQKKIFFNSDNTFSITELKRKQKKENNEKTKISPKIDEKLVANTSIDMSRRDKLKNNEDIIKSTKKIVLKGKIYYCRYNKCCYNTISRSIAIRHMWTHTGEKPFKCQICSQAFREKRKLSSHLMSHNACFTTNQNTFGKRRTGGIVCPECERSYGSVKQMFSHIRLIHGQQKANTYREQYNKQRNLKKSVANQKVSPSKSKVTGKWSQTGPNQWKNDCLDLLYNILESEDSIPFREPVDCKQYADYYTLIHNPMDLSTVRERLLSDLYSNPQEFCKDMRLIFKNSRAYNTNKSSRVYIMTLNLSTLFEEKFRQIISNFESENKSRVRKESVKKSPKKLEISKQSKDNTSEVVTEDNNNWKCDFKCCSRSYSGKQNLKRHQLEIHKKLSKPLFYGSIREKTEVKFFIPKPIQSVEKAVNNMNKTAVNPPTHPSDTNKNFVCNYKNCKQSYITISGLYKHKKRVHMLKGERSQKFKNKTIAQHITESSSTVGFNKDVRTYGCPEPNCSSSFVWIKNLRTHMRDKHNMKTPEISNNINNNIKEVIQDSIDTFQCTFKDCPFEATSRTAQISHYRTHYSSDDNPFKCQIEGCSYSTQKLSLLKYHVLNKHSEQEFFRATEKTGVKYPSWY